MRMSTSNIKPLRIKMPQLDDWDKQRMHDYNRIQAALMDHGWYATTEQCKYLWNSYSEDHWCAGWIPLPDTDEELYSSIKEYIEM